MPPRSPSEPAERSAIESLPLGADGETCASCRAALTEDQRYCLNCGRRRGETRVPFPPNGPQSAEGPAKASGASGRDWTPIVALGGLGALAIVLVVGVLIGKSASPQTKQVAAAPQVIRVEGGGAGGNTGGASGAGFKSDWPAGKSGYTIELGTLKKDGATPDQVAAAKKAAAAKGAPDVGALDSDDFASLPGGVYLICSGRFKTAAAASKALKSVKGKFSKARVVKVAGDGGAGGAGASAGKPTVDKAQLQNLDNLSGDDYVKRSRKLPSTTVLPGKAPPKDDKAPGGGSGGVEIK